MTRHRIALALIVPLALADRSASANKAPAGRYTVSNGTVYDTRTKLTWQQASAPGSYTWANAKTYCGGLSLSGSGWRLPTEKELLSIDDLLGPGTIDSTAFVSAVNNYWSSTPVAGSPGNAWGVEYQYGYTFNSPVTQTWGVRCVR